MCQSTGKEVSDPIVAHLTQLEVQKDTMDNQSVMDNGVGASWRRLPHPAPCSISKAHWSSGGMEGRQGVKGTTKATLSSEEFLPTAAQMASRNGLELESERCMPR